MTNNCLCFWRVIHQFSGVIQHTLFNSRELLLKVYTVSSPDDEGLTQQIGYINLTTLNRSPLFLKLAKILPSYLVHKGRNYRHGKSINNHWKIKINKRNELKTECMTKKWMGVNWSDLRSVITMTERSRVRLSPTARVRWRPPVYCSLWLNIQSMLMIHRAFLVSNKFVSQRETF